MNKVSIASAIARNELTWFEDSPDAGDPDCICSYCGSVIKAEELCYRCYNTKEGTEARLCDNCLRQLDKPED